MAKSKPQDQSLTEGLANVNLYKRNQGRLTRQLTAVAVAAVFILGAWTLAGTFAALRYPDWARYGIPIGISAIGCWFAFRVVNYPRFADFLISVQAEMDKVSWASKEELKRSTIVVICTMFFLAAALRMYDFFWITLFRALGILQPAAPTDAGGLGS